MMSDAADLIIKIGIKSTPGIDLFLLNGFSVIAVLSHPDAVANCYERFGGAIREGKLKVIQGACYPASFGDAARLNSTKPATLSPLIMPLSAEGREYSEFNNFRNIRRVDLVEIIATYGAPHYLAIDSGQMNDAILFELFATDLKPRYISVELSESTPAEGLRALSMLSALGYRKFNYLEEEPLRHKALISRRLDGSYFKFEFKAGETAIFGEALGGAWVSLSTFLENLGTCTRKLFFWSNQNEGQSKETHPHVKNPQPQLSVHAGRAEVIECSPTPLFSVVITCKNRLSHLQTTLRSWASQKHVEVIVVDYGCTEGTYEFVRSNFPSVRVYRVEDDPIFSLSRARNIGAFHTRADHLVFSDADVSIEFDLVDWFTGIANAGTFYSIDPRDNASLAGTVIVRKIDFYSVGGYDENFRGWGWEDFDLYARLKRIGLKQALLTDDGCFTIDHGDDERLLSSAKGGTGSRVSAHLVGRVYTSLKAVIFAQTGKEAGEKTLVVLMEKVRNFVVGLESSSNLEETFKVDILMANSNPKSTAISYVVANPWLTRAADR